MDNSANTNTNNVDDKDLSNHNRADLSKRINHFFSKVAENGATTFSKTTFSKKTLSI